MLFEKSCKGIFSEEYFNYRHLLGLAPRLMGRFFTCLVSRDFTPKQRTMRAADGGWVEEGGYGLENEPKRSFLPGRKAAR